MFKKILSALLLFCMFNIAISPAFAASGEKSSAIIEADFKTDLNVNKASKGQVVQFITTQDYTVNNYTIPKGTIFSGEVKSFKKGRWAYRRAKVTIAIKDVILPNGQNLQIKARTKKHVIKSSGVANAAKGIVTAPLAIVVGAAGVTVILVEAITIIGLVAVVPTAYGFGRAVGGITHGINYKRERGDEIKLKILSIDGASK